MQSLAMCRLSPPFPKAMVKTNMLPDCNMSALSWDSLLSEWIPSPWNLDSVTIDLEFKLVVTDSGFLGPCSKQRMNLYLEELAVSMWSWIAKVLLTCCRVSFPLLIESVMSESIFWSVVARKYWDVGLLLLGCISDSCFLRSKMKDLISWTWLSRRADSYEGIVIIFWGQSWGRLVAGVMPR